MAAPKSDRSGFAKLGLGRNAPDEYKAIASKLTPATKSTAPNRRDSGVDLQLNRDSFEKITKSTGQDIIDAESVFQLLPDIELAKQVLVGSILSPKDMAQADLGFTVNDRRFEGEITRTLLSEIEDYFKNDYKIDEDLDSMLEEILFTHGARVMAVLPENSLDRAINGSMQLSVETYNRVARNMEAGRPMGFLGHPRRKGVSMETFRDRGETSQKIVGEVNYHHTPEKGTASRLVKGSVTLESINVTDNFDVLKVPGAKERGRRMAIGQRIKGHNLSMEAASKGLTDEQINKLYDRNSETKAEPTHVVIPQAHMDRPSVGHPLTMKLPVESVIPVHSPGDPEDHIGYFIVLGENGRPVVREESRDYYGEMRSSFQSQGNDQSSDLVRRTKEALNGVPRNQAIEFEQIHNAYAAIIENDLTNRLRNGLYDEELELGMTDSVYEIMLYRAFRNNQTQLLYLPAELVTYIAFDYNDKGIGESLLTKSKILSSMRTVLMFAETMGGVRNAVGRKKVNITTDPEDPDQQKTINDIMMTVLESGQRGFPVGSPDPSLIQDHLNRAGYDFAIDAQGDGYPGTKVEFDDFTTQVTEGNKDLQDRLRRQHISSFGLNPEQVDPTQSPDFATSVVNNNLVLTRRVIRWQKRYTRKLGQFVQSYTRYSSTLRERLLKIIDDNKGQLSKEQKKLSHDEVLDNLIDALEVNLPAPDTTRLDQQSQAFEQYSNMLDKALEAYITSDLFPADTMNRDPDTVNHAITVVRAYYLRMWLERNNVMPELDKLTEMDGKKPTFGLLDIQKAQMGSLGTTLQEYIEGVEQIKKDWAEKYGEQEEEETTEGDDEFGASTGDGDEFGNSEDGGDDDGFGDDTETDGEASDGNDPLTEEDDFGGTGGDDETSPDEGEDGEDPLKDEEEL